MFTVTVILLLAFHNVEMAKVPSGKGVKSCGDKQFYCSADDWCIPAVWQCDGRSECLDGEDEKDCDWKCSKSEFWCPSDGTCISSSWKCDGTKDCPKGEDEVGCNVCKFNEFQCSPNVKAKDNCIPKRWKCDGEPDCKNGADEKNC